MRTIKKKDINENFKQFKKYLKRCYIYFCFNTDGEVIYVGQAHKVGLSAYEQSKIEEVSSIGVKEYPDRAAMEIMEYYYVAKLWPKYNKYLKNHGPTTLELKDSIEMIMFSVDEFKKNYRCKI